jgi:outer membrane autotransporter protein
MNRTHRIVINRRTGARQAVSETAKSSNGGPPALRAALLLGATLLGALMSPAGHAQTWLSPVPGDWFDAANWSSGAVPTRSDDVDISTPGTAQITGGLFSAETNYLSLGRNAAGALSVTNGGILRAAKIFVDGAGGPATMLVEGAGSRADASSGLLIGYAGTGTLTIRSGGTVRARSIEFGLQPGAQGTLNLDVGGTLETGGLYALVPANAGASGTFNWSGGTLRVVNGSLVSAMDATLTGKGSTLDTNGFNAAMSGVLSGAGSLVKVGAGTLTLSGQNLHAGGTRVEQGVLAIASGLALGSGALSIANAELRGTASTTVSNGVGLDGPATISAQAGTTLRLEGKLSYGSALSIGSKGNTGIVEIASNAGSIVTPGALRVEFGTLRSAGVAIGNVVNHAPTTFVAAGATLDFNDNIAPTLPVGYLQGAGTVVTGSQASTTLAVAAGDFSGAIQGAGSLQKSLAGTLTLRGASSYAGATRIGAGTLALADNGALPAGSLLDVSTGATFDMSAITGTGTAVNALAGGGDVVLGAKSLTLSGGTSAFFNGEISGSGTLYKSGPGVQVLAGAANHLGGTVISGGTLAVEGDGSLAAGGAVRVEDGARFRIRQVDSGALTIGALSGSGRVDMGATTLTTGDASNSIFSGEISGTGGLEKQGSGTLFLNGVNSYTGATQVRSGRLSVGGTAADSGASVAGAVNVDDGATLSGFGRIGGSVNVASGGHLAAGDPAAGNGIGTLRIDGDLSLANGSQLDFDLGAPSGLASVPGQGDNVAVGGNLSLGDATLNVRDAGGMGPGLYNLFSWGGKLSTSGGGFAPPAGSTVQILTGSKQINLITAAGYTLNFWNGNGLASPTQMGGGNGTWSAIAPTWADEGGIASGPLQQPGFAIFGGAAGTVVVDNTDGPVIASGMQFASDGYRVSGGTLALVADKASPGPVEVRVGDGSGASAGWTATIDSAVAGSDGLAKTGSGTLVLTGANSYGGGTAVRAGTLQISSDGNLGAATGGLALEGGTLRASGTITSARTVSLGAGAGAGGFEVDPTRTLTLDGEVSGAGTLVKTGLGTLALGAANTYAGGTNIAAGSLQARVTGALGSGPVSVAGNASLLFGGTADAGKLAIDVAARGALPTDNAGFVQFGDKSSAGHARIVTQTDASAEFRDSASAGNAVIENRGGNTTLGFNATAGKAHITNFAGGAINLLDDASAGQATFVNGSGGLIDIFDRASADQATVVNQAGGRLRIRSLTNDGIAIGALSGAGDVILGAKALTTGGLNTNTEVSGTVSGAGGSIVKVGSGTLTLSGANTYTGGTALKLGRLDVGHSQALGTGSLAMDDGTTLGFAADGLDIANAIALTGRNDPVIDTGAFDAAISGAISGGGFITKQGTGTLTLSGANTYTGATNVAQGTLRAGAMNTLSAGSAHSVATGATLDLAGFSQAVASLANSGTVSLAGAAPGTTLTVNGNYAGSNGVLRLGTALNATGPSDRLVIDGGAATGTTRVQFTQLGGLGALTSGNGIEVITAQNGATTTAQSTKDAFALEGGHVDAGAYEYRLHAADASGAGENWYLRSTLPGTTPEVPEVPEVPGVPALPAAPIVTYRAEASLYAALPSQLRQGNLAMLGDLRRRVGDDDVKGTASPAAPAERRAWARVLSTDIDIRQGGTVSPASQGRLTGFQAGTDLLAARNWRAGVYVGQLDGDARVNGFASGVANLYTGRNDLRSQYVGVYGTFSGDNGFYADAVVQSGRHRYTAQPGFGGGVEGKGNSLLGSIEVGRSFALGAGGWQIEPQLQLIHQHLDLDDTAIAGAVVQPRADRGWIARAGVRVKGHIDTGMGTLQPYGRFNVYRTSSGTDVAQFVNGATRTGISAPIGGTSTELAGGFTLALGARTSLYGEIGKRWSSGGDAKVKSAINGGIGVRVKW